MSAGPGVVAVAVGAAAAVGVGWGGATLAARAWRRLGRAEPLAEAALALFGLIGTAAVLTVALTLAWGAPFAALREPAVPGAPIFAASILGTIGGQVAVLAWARGLGAPVARALPDARALVVGLAGGAGALALSAAWTQAAARVGRPVADQALVAGLVAAPEGPGRVAALAFVVAVAPLLEELVFRGYLYGALAARLGAAGAIVGSALLFGLFHLSDPAVVPVLAAMGAILGVIRHRTGSVWPAVLAHLVNNLAAMALALG